MKTDNILSGRGLRNTKHRRSILEVLEKSSGPLTVTEVFLKLKAKNPSLCLSTIYRIFEALCEKGLVIKTNLFDDGKARFEIGREGHWHYAVCVGCRRIISIEDCPIGEREFAILKNTEGFSATGHRLEIYGFCRDCMNIR